MVIAWTAGAYTHLQEYYGIGFVLNWPGVSSYVPYVTYNEILAGDVILTEILTAAAVITETLAVDVVLTETTTKDGIL